MQRSKIPVAVLLIAAFLLGVCTTRHDNPSAEALKAEHTRVSRSLEEARGHLDREIAADTAATERGTPRLISSRRFYAEVVDDLEDRLRALSTVFNRENESEVVHALWITGSAELVAGEIARTEL